jgi:hypothetical protein
MLQHAAPDMRSSMDHSSARVPASLRELSGDQAGPAAAPVPRFTSLQGMPELVLKPACSRARPSWDDHRTKNKRKPH